MDSEFCCAGCATVYSILVGSGLESFYTIRAEQTLSPRKTANSKVQYQYLCDPSAQSLYIIDDAGKSAAKFQLDGVECAACVWLIERLPELCPGVIEVRVDFSTSQVNVRFDASICSLGNIASCF
ncbi:MAG: heavy metal translocating P-type ATPase metal-binding domain-containing protein, partial [Bdellovibrionales bacterium]|nr:heavy metal translocating P-type ATPase metal-binding domain-containing protein [Bdellovibrionales bacterium]